MNNIKTKTINRLDVDHLGKLIRIKLCLAAGHIVNIDMVYDLWKTEKGSREIAKNL